jgi:hypothetical protein
LTRALASQGIELTVLKQAFGMRHRQNPHRQFIQRQESLRLRQQAIGRFHEKERRGDLHTQQLGLAMVGVKVRVEIARQGLAIQ